MDNELVIRGHFIEEIYKKYDGLNLVFDAYGLIRLVFSYKLHRHTMNPFISSLRSNLKRMKQHNTKIYVDMGAVDEIENLVGAIKFFDISQNDELCIEEIMVLLSKSINIQFDGYITGFKDLKIKNEMCKTVYISDAVKDILDFIEVSDKVLANFNNK